MIARAVPPEAVEGLRALLPCGYHAGVRAYHRAVEGLTEGDLSEHYTRGLSWFDNEFSVALRTRLEALSGGAWDLRDHVAYAAGSDVDLMAHVVEARLHHGPASVFPGDWYGFRAASATPEAVRFELAPAPGALLCACVPSVRNGHLTEEHRAWLSRGEACLLNINLFPTLSVEERHSTALAIAPLLDRALLSVSFSRGFGLTASQLGVLLVPRRHPWRALYEVQWRWFTYFHNALAARAFLALDEGALAAVDRARREAVGRWLAERGLPVVSTGSYYVRSFRPEGELPEHLSPLYRYGVLRLCMKPREA
ncbi:MAG: hypothetical protein HY909_11140 [Deltaproteobacteria bacterium]|nr:hypothetical protein [Deltaproteobacteria bacterium]